MARRSHWMTTSRDTDATTTETRTMKISRYAIVVGTLLMAALAGTSNGDTVRQAACTADALTGLLGTATANGAVCR
jgi:hypothetical protein